MTLPAALPRLASFRGSLSFGALAFVMLGAAPGALAQDAPAADAAGAEDVELERAILTLLDAARDPVRIAVAPVKDDDFDRRKVVEAKVARLLLANAKADIITPSRIEAVVGEAATKAAADGSVDIYTPLSADHVVLTDVLSAGGAPEASLRLLHVESGEILATAQAVVAGQAAAQSASAKTVRGTVALMATELELALRKSGGPVRYQRVAVAPFDARGNSVKASGIDRFVQAELISALRDRGLLVVERERLGEALEQISIGEALGEKDAPALGEALSAQAVVVGSVAEAGEVFSVDARLIATNGGAVLGGTTGSMPRENTVSLANRAIETRTPVDAMFRSAVAPGWGQLYNRQPFKAAIVASAVYGAAALSISMVGAAIASALLYQFAEPDDMLTGAARTANIEAARGVRNGLVLAAGGVVVATVGLWGAGTADALLSALYPE